ncbi:MAG: hypothetical protein JXA57_08375 [Armatimonadetes bacterium]|nr:hypothetical protein [Armatimonadota bacterium]
MFRLRPMAYCLCLFLLTSAAWGAEPVLLGVEEPTGAAVSLLPGPVSPEFLGFGSTREDVLRLMGEPTRVAVTSAEREQWFYGLSRVTLDDGRLVGWCPLNTPIPTNVGRADARGVVAPGAEAAAIVQARGTPRAVADFDEWQVWFYEGIDGYVLHRGVLDHHGINLTFTPRPSPAEPRIATWSYASGPSGGSPSSMAGSSGPVHVRSYFRKDGTFVRSHSRSRPRR